MRVGKSIQISAVPDKIWPYLTDPKKLQMWFNTFKKCEYASEKRTGIGTRYYVEEKVPGPLRKIHFEATQWDENEQLHLKMISGENVKDYEIRLKMEPTELGTIFSFTENIGMPFGLIGKILGALGQRRAEKMVEAMLIELQRSTEDKRPSR